MKKLLLTAALGITSFGIIRAADFTVYNNGQLGSGITYYGWHNAAVNQNATAPDQTTGVIELKPASSNDQTASFGLNLAGETKTGELANATLNFSYYAVGQGNYAVKLTGGSEEVEEQFVSISDGSDGWVDVAINVKEKYPAVIEQWEAGANNGTGYVFSMVLSNETPESAIYIKNIYYSGIDTGYVEPEQPTYAQPETVPAPAQSDILPLFTSTRGAESNFAWANWEQATSYETISIDGKNVLQLKNFNFQGWDINPAIDLSDYNTLHVDYWTPDGTIFKVTPINTASSPGELLWNAPTVVKEAWNSYDIPLSYYSDGGVNLTNINQFKIDAQPDNAAYGYIANIYFYKSDNQGGGNDNGDDNLSGNGLSYSGTLTGTYPGAPEINGEVQTDLAFTANWTAKWNQDATVTFTVVVTPEVTGLSPQIFVNGAYEGTFVNGSYTTKNKYEENANPNFALFMAYLGGSTEQLPLNYVVGSTNSSTGGDDNNGDDTGDDDNTEPNGDFEGSFTNAQLVGGEAGQTIPYTAEWEAALNENGTLSFEYTVDPVVEGLVVKLFENGTYVGDFARTKAGETFYYTTTQTYEAGNKTNFSIGMDYAGGSLTPQPIPFVVPEVSDDNNGDDEMDNLWTNAELSVSKTYFATESWTEIAAPEISLADNNISLTTPAEMGYQQWQGQVFVTTNIPVSASKTYDFSMILNTDKDAIVTVKPTVNGLDNEYFVAEQVPFTAPSSDYSFSNIEGPADGNLVLVLDFGGNPAQTFTITNIVFLEVTDSSDAIEALNSDNINAPAEYYNLQGVKVANPQKGIFIRVQGNKSSKVVIK